MITYPSFGYKINNIYQYLYTKEDFTANQMLKQYLPQKKITIRQRKKMLGGKRKQVLAKVAILTWAILTWHGGLLEVGRKEGLLTCQRTLSCRRPDLSSSCH
jgi:hypothetical protein